MKIRRWVETALSRQADMATAGRRFSGSVVSFAALICCCSCGCTALLSPISGVPARRLPPQFLAEPEANKDPIDLARLRREPTKKYLLDKGDILGIYIEGVLGQAEEAPPVHFPEKDSDVPPALGFPIPVREDGTLPLPLIEPIPVQGLTLAQAEKLIREAYTETKKILKPGRDRIIVTLLRERTYQVIVVRQDGIQDAGKKSEAVDRKLIKESTQQGRGHVINLKAYKNDLLHALAETGGLPGLDAKNEVKILRGRLADSKRRDAFITNFYAQQQLDPCSCPPPLPDDPSILRIPLRLPPGETPQFTPKDVILEEGDIVYIESRETEVFYTGGLLKGGEFPLPRDYDLDVLGAMAMGGQSVSGGVAGVGGVFGSLAAIPPSQLYVIRKTPCNGQVVIAIDLTLAVEDPRERILVQPGDTLILRYKPIEEIANFSLISFFTYGIQSALARR